MVGRGQPCAWTCDADCHDGHTHAGQLRQTCCSWVV
jgi:hypothetical protein